MPYEVHVDYANETVIISSVHSGTAFTCSKLTSNNILCAKMKLKAQTHSGATSVADIIHRQYETNSTKQRQITR